MDNDIYPCLFRLVHKGQSLEDNLDIHLEESTIESEETLHIIFVLNPEEFFWIIKRKMNIPIKLVEILREIGNTIEIDREFRRQILQVSEINLHYYY